MIFFYFQLSKRRKRKNVTNGIEILIMTTTQILKRVKVLPVHNQTKVPFRRVLIRIIAIRHVMTQINGIPTHQNGGIGHLNIETMTIEEVDFFIINFTFFFTFSPKKILGNNFQSNYFYLDL